MKRTIEGETCPDEELRTLNVGIPFRVILNAGFAKNVLARMKDRYGDSQGVAEKRGRREDTGRVTPSLWTLLGMSN